MVIRVRLLMIATSPSIPIALVERWRERRLVRRLPRNARQVMCRVTLVDRLAKTEIPEHIIPIPQVI